ncbi:MAG: hypothetical protein ONA90_09750 [candidate division KSB1 bacterium]|nr:hypothetical protein [candidate division KSB1 bacterium]
MGGPIFLETSTPRDRPPSLIEVISQIQQYATAELYGAKIPTESLLLKNQTLLIYTGFKGGAGGMLLGVLLLPISLAVMDTLIPVFGGDLGSMTHITRYYDKIWNYVMTFFWPLGYWSLFVTQLAPVYYGQTPMLAINWLCSGWITGVILKALLGAMFYHILLFVMTPQRMTEWIFSESTPFIGWILTWDDRLAWCNWYSQFHPLWVTASLYLVLTAAGLSLSLVAMLIAGHYRAKKIAQFNVTYEVLG